jgi:hypothetical protein
MLRPSQNQALNLHSFLQSSKTKVSQHSTAHFFGFLVQGLLIVVFPLHHDAIGSVDHLSLASLDEYSVFS